VTDTAGGHHDLSVPRLLLINGLPGSGKSTLAARYVAERPLALCLDVDVVRGMLGAWLDRPEESGLMARRLALAMARVALEEECDVVVPQFLGRPDFIGELEALARELGAEFAEVVLVDEPLAAAARLAQRATGPMTPTQRDAHVLLERAGGLGALAGMHRRLQGVLSGRPQARRVFPVAGDVDRTYRDLLDQL
jgi:predicted kinase